MPGSRRSATLSPGFRSAQCAASSNRRVSAVMRTCSFPCVLEDGQHLSYSDNTSGLGSGLDGLSPHPFGQARWFG
jgi:hypothetical protein